VFIKAGFQVPAMGLAFVELEGKTGGGAFKHNGPMPLNVGIIVGSTVMLRVVVVAHCPAFGVNVYTVVPGVAVLTGKSHVPVIGVELVELIGNIGAAAF
jgi:hypothetical protein